MKAQEAKNLLQTQGLKVHFPVTAGIIRDRVIAWVKALDGVDLSLRARAGGGNRGGIRKR